MPNNIMHKHCAPGLKPQKKAKTKGCESRKSEKMINEALSVDAVF